MYVMPLFELVPLPDTNECLLTGVWACLQSLFAAGFFG